MCKLTLPLQVGKKYVRKDGKIARVVVTDRKDDRYGHTVVYLVDDGKAEYTAAVRPDGTSDALYASLVSDYVEPIGPRWLAVASDGTFYHTSVRDTPESLRKSYGDVRVIKVVEVRD